MRPHPDVDLLALAALGEPALDGDDTAHLAGCARCATTLEELRRTVGTVRGPRPEPDHAAAPVQVPAHVWQGIAAELALDPSVRPRSIGPTKVPAASSSGAAPTHRLSDPSPAIAPLAGTGGHRHREVGDVVDLPARRPARLGRLLAVAAAGLVVGAAGTAVVLGLDDDAGPAGPEVLAATDLEAFGAGEGTDVAGSARLAATTDAPEGADRVLQVWLSDLPDTGEDFLEAWLIDAETGAMVSLGPVSRDGSGAVTAELVVPGTVDVGRYALVDVSAEPPDGDPTHSGASLVRGTLGT